MTTCERKELQEIIRELTYGDYHTAMARLTRLATETLTIQLDRAASKTFLEGTGVVTTYDMISTPPPNGKT